MFATKTDVLDYIARRIETGGANSDEFDLDQIAGSCFESRPVAGGYIQAGNDELFWQEVERAALNSEYKLLREIVDAHELALRLQRKQQESADRRGELIRKALADGVGATAIAEALGVNRQRIYAMSK